MLSKTIINLSRTRSVLLRSSHRNISFTPIVLQQAAAKLDPIQQLFVDKVREYTKKSKAAGGGMVDMTPDAEKTLQNDLEKLAKQYGATGPDFLKFPTFNFTDGELQQVGVNVEAKTETQSESAVEAQEEEESAEDYKAYWDP